MNARLKEIYSNLPECDVFADIGCDHGYMTLMMLKGDKCKRAIISDVSKMCLSKAENLLQDYVDEGRVESVVSDGFDNVPPCDEALIAGMGGEEIISIIERAKSLPENLILQPMKNTDKVRVASLKAGYRVVKDYVFFNDGKFYDLLVLKKGEDSLTEEEINFGRTNVIERGSAFKAQLRQKIEKYKVYLSQDNLSEQVKTDMLSEISKMENYV